MEVATWTQMFTQACGGGGAGGRAGKDHTTNTKGERREAGRRNKHFHAMWLSGPPNSKSSETLFRMIASNGRWIYL